MSVKEAAKKWKRMIFALFHVGCIGFGGGSALIPVLFDKTVKSRKLVSEEEFNKDVVIATITPGALPVEIAAGIGRKCFGKILCRRGTDAAGNFRTGFKQNMVLIGSGAEYRAKERGMTYVI